MSRRGLVTEMPIWVRAPGIIALVLAGIVISATLVGAAGVGGGSGREMHAPVQRQEPPADHGGHQPPSGTH